MWLKFLVAAVCVAAPLEASAADDGFHLTLSAASEYDAGSGLCGINVTLDRQSAAKLYRFTSDHTGETVEVVLDGRVIQTPRIMMPMPGRSLQVIDTEVNAANCAAIAAALATGTSTLGLRAIPPAE